MKALDGKTRQRQTQAIELGRRIVQRHGDGYAALVVAGNTGHVFQLIGRVTRLHERANHVGLLTLVMRLADGSIGEVTARLGENTRRHTGTRNRPVADDARIQIAVDRKRQRTRDGRCRHNEQIGTGALRAQGVALADAKPVLLIDDHERQMLERNVIRKDRVGAKEHIKLARFQLGMDPVAL